MCRKTTYSAERRTGCAAPSQCPQLSSNFLYATPYFKHAARGWATNSSRLWQPFPTLGWPDGCPGAAFYPSGDQSRRKIRQQPRIAGQAKIGIGEPDAKQPIVELRGPLQAEQIADIERVVERGGLIIQHHVVGPGHPHDEGHAGSGEQRQQIVHVVLVGLGMVGVTDVHAERQAKQLAAEMVLEPGADDLLAVIEIFRADEADHAVDQQRIESARNGVGARLAGLLVDAVMGVGRKRRALPGFEIHDVVADRTAPQRQSRLMGLPQKSEIDAKTPVGSLRAR